MIRQTFGEHQDLGEMTDFFLFEGLFRHRSGALRLRSLAEVTRHPNDSFNAPCIQIARGMKEYSTTARYKNIFTAFLVYPKSRHQSARTVSGVGHPTQSVSVQISTLIKMRCRPNRHTALKAVTENLAARFSRASCLCIGQLLPRAHSFATNSISNLPNGE